jgi:hypothetical protein
MREKHNGFSNEINRGNWEKVDKEICAWVRDTKKYFGQINPSRSVRPARREWITKKDVRKIVRLLPRDYCNQRRLFKMVLYFRSFKAEGFLYIPRQTWRKFAKSRLLKEFRELIIDKDILKTNPSFCRGHFTKSYKLTFLRPAKEDEILKDREDNPITEYKEALLAVYGSVEKVIAHTGLKARTLGHKRRN